MEPVSALTPNSDGDEDKNCLMALSVTELISILRTAYLTVVFDRVEEVLVDKESKLKSDIGMLSEKLEMERLERMHVEEQLKKYKEQFEKGKKAEERYEKLLQAVKNSDLSDGNTVTELRNKNRKLEDEKRRAESETESWKRKCEELNERLLTVEKGAKSSMNGYVEIRANAEDISGAPRNTDRVVPTEALDEMKLNEVVNCAVDSGNTPADSSPSQRKMEFVNLASDDAKNVKLETEDGHDDKSTQRKYNTRSWRQGSHDEVHESSGKSFWCNMPEGQVAKISKRNRGKQTIHNTSELKNQASKKGKMDAQHQTQINGNEIASPTVQTKIGTIDEQQSQEGSYEMVIDRRVDGSTRAFGTPEQCERWLGLGPPLTQMMHDYMSQYLTPSWGTIVEKQSQEGSHEMVIDRRGDASTRALGTPEQCEHGMGLGFPLNQMMHDYMSQYLTPSWVSSTPVPKFLYQNKNI